MSRRSRIAALAAGASLLLLLAGCTGPAQPGPATSSSGSPSAAASGSPVASGQPSQNPPAATYPTSAEAYARAAVSAWANHDTTRLGQLNAASDTVFSTLDGGDYNRNFTTLYMCDGAAGSTYCTFYNAVGDALRLRLRNDLLGHPHAITEGVFTPITFPTDYQAYAQEALTDWVSRNTAAVSLLTGKPGDSAFSSVPAGVRNEDWVYDRTDGAAGHVYYIFHNTAGDTLAFGFVNPGIQSPPANRHGLITQVVFTPHS